MDTHEKNAWDPKTTGRSATVSYFSGEKSPRHSSTNLAAMTLSTGVPTPRGVQRRGAAKARPTEQFDEPVNNHILFVGALAVAQGARTQPLNSNTAYTKRTKNRTTVQPKEKKKKCAARVACCPIACGRQKHTRAHAHKHLRHLAHTQRGCT